jgi:twinkle protein|tara:strand:- start:456 stop:2216 length:1761 start_codon:yes stop_codon:yes gene_type:complete
MNEADLGYFFENIHDDCRVPCPECSTERKKKNVKTLSVTIDGGDCLYQCHHCGLSGRYNKPSIQTQVKPQKVRAISVPSASNQELINEYLLSRSIDPLSVTSYSVVSGTKYFNGSGEMDAVGFVYGDREAVKWRSIQGKNFTQDGAARTLWGIDQVKEDAKDIFIVEGETDLLACASSGLENVVSVPNGAPQKVSNRKVNPEEDNKFAYVWAAREQLEKAERIILATDQDEAGIALSEELARRIGRAKCWTVEYPDGCKDPNDVLKHHGSEAVRKMMENAKPVPLEGVYSADDYTHDIEHLYKEGIVGGASTGLASVDGLFTVVQGQLSIVTGIPGSGKSEFIDQLMVNLARREGWKFAVASFENPPPLHIAKLSEKYIGKPFFEGKTARMSGDEKTEALNWVTDHFLFLEQRGGDSATIDSILDRAKQAVMRLGVRGLVIDPYNYIQQSSSVDNEHQGINEMLTRLVTFARAHDVHIWFIAHPAKMMTNQDGSTPVPKGMNISGSAAFFAKADLGITVHLDKDKNVEIHCWKCRFKWVGTTGTISLDYDIPTGRYTDISYGDFVPSGGSDGRSNDWHETGDDWDF